MIVPILDQGTVDLAPASRQDIDMKMRRIFLAASLLLALPHPSHAQLWSGILSPTNGSGACTLLPTSTYAGCGIDWQDYTGVPGEIPSGSWTQSGTTITTTGSDQTSAIQSALNSCGTNHYVLLGGTPSSPQTFVIDGNLSVPSNCVLRGAGANAAILNCLRTSGPCVYIGNSTDDSLSAAGAVNVTAGATAGSTSLTLSSVTGMSAGQNLVISELNNPTYVDICSSQGTSCATFNNIVYNWGDGNGSARTRGQIVSMQACLNPSVIP